MEEDQKLYKVESAARMGTVMRRSEKALKDGPATVQSVERRPDGEKCRGDTKKPCSFTPVSVKTKRRADSGLCRGYINKHRTNKL